MNIAKLSRKMKKELSVEKKIDPETVIEISKSSDVAKS